MMRIPLYKKNSFRVLQKVRNRAPRSLYEEIGENEALVSLSWTKADLLAKELGGYHKKPGSLRVFKFGL